MAIIVALFTAFIVSQLWLGIIFGITYAYGESRIRRLSRFIPAMMALCGALVFGAPTKSWGIVGYSSGALGSVVLAICLTSIFWPTIEPRLRRWLSRRPR
jgi:hypothetical protein